MDENDWDGWKLLTERLGKTACSWSATTCSSPTPKILKRGIDEGIANSILIKVNQIGTLTETLEAIEHGGRGGLHRRDLAPLRRDRGRDHRRHRGGDRGGQIKTGSLSRSDRIAKYNQLLRIEEELGASARYPGRAALPLSAG